MVEDKYIKELTVGTIDGILTKYRTYPFFPDMVEIHIGRHTKVPEEVREYAREKKIRVVRLGYNFSEVLD